MATVTKTYSLKVETQDSEVDELNKKLETTEGDIQGIEDAGDKMTGGLISGFKGVYKGALTAVAGLRTMKGAIIATGVGVFVAIVGSLAAAFSNTEKGQDMLNKAMTIFGSVVGNVTDIFAEYGMMLIEGFKDPVQLMKDFGKAFVDNIMTKITSAIETVGYLGSAFGKVFSGDFAGAVEDAETASKKFVDALTGVENSYDRIVNFSSELVTEISKEMKIAGEIADQRAKADKIERKILVERAQANKDRAQLMEQAINKEIFSLEERIEFLREAGRIEDEITAKEIEAKQLRLDAKVRENALSGSTKEDLLEEAQLRADLINLETAKLSKAKEVTSQIIAFNAEVAAAQTALELKQKATQDAADIAEDERQKAIKEKNKILEQLKLDEEAVSFTQKQELAQTRALAELEALNATEEQKAATILFWQGKVLDAKIKDAKEEGIVDEVLQKQKIAIIGQTFGAISKILGENSKAGKAFGIAQALTNTYLGVTEVLSNETTIPEPFGSIQKAVSIAGVLSTGFAAVKQIKSVTPSSAASTISPPTTGATASPPAFNIVGADSNNQLASAIGGQTQQPVQAFVVSQDVTTAQSLERNIISSATIG